MSTLKADTLVASDGTSPVTLTKQSAAKAWISAANDASIYDSFNASTGTDHGTGDYSFALTNSFSGINLYAQNSTVFTSAAYLATRNSGRDAAGTIAIEVFNTSGSLNDRSTQTSAHGDLA